MREELLLVTAPQHPLARKKQVTPQDLARQSFVLFESGSGSAGRSRSSSPASTSRRQSSPRPRTSRSSRRWSASAWASRSSRIRRSPAKCGGHAVLRPDRRAAAGARNRLGPPAPEPRAAARAGDDEHLDASAAASSSRSAFRRAARSRDPVLSVLRAGAWCLSAWVRACKWPVRSAMVRGAIAARRTTHFAPRHLAHFAPGSFAQAPGTKHPARSTSPQGECHIPACFPQRPERSFDGSSGSVVHGSQPSSCIRARRAAAGECGAAWRAPRHRASSSAPAG